MSDGISDMITYANYTNAIRFVNFTNFLINKCTTLDSVIMKFYEGGEEEEEMRRNYKRNKLNNTGKLNGVLGFYSNSGCRRVIRTINNSEVRSV